MVISIEQWRARIGILVSRSRKKHLVAHEKIKVVNYKVFLLTIMLLLTHGDTKSNPVSKRRISNYFSYCHLNVNSNMAYNKLSLISVYNTIHKYGIICISESYIDNSVDNNVLSIDDYNLIRADHPDNQKKGGVCMQFKEQLKLRQVLHISLNVFFLRIQ